MLERYNPTVNDIFLSLGAPWQHACYLDAILDIKDTIHSFIVIVYDLIPYLYPHFYEGPMSLENITLSLFVKLQKSCK